MSNVEASVGRMDLLEDLASGLRRMFHLNDEMIRAREAKLNSAHVPGDRSGLIHAKVEAACGYELVKVIDELKASLQQLESRIISQKKHKPR